MARLTSDHAKATVVVSIRRAEIPKREAWSRLIATLSCGAFASKSLDTLASSGILCILSGSFLRPFDHLGDVDALQSVFEAASRQPHTDVDVLSHLNEEVRTDYPTGDLRPQPLLTTTAHLIM